MNYQDMCMQLSFDEKANILAGKGLNTQEIERLGIDSVEMSDGPAGVKLSNNKQTDSGTNGETVCYPTESAIGATWNKKLTYEIGRALGRDCKKEDIELLLAPAVNMKRTPLCGRNFEYFSEDPYLSGILAAEYINGIQDEGVGACLKHYAANNQEEYRNFVNSEIDERTLRELYLKVFEVTLKNSKPLTIMCAYNKINGIYCSENPYLLKTILREEWGYDGLVMSDWGAVHNISKAIAGGLDLQMPNNDNIVQQLKNGVENDIVSEQDIHMAAERVLKFVGEIKSMKKVKTEYSRDKNHNIAREVMAEAITLLENEDNILPIKENQYKKIAILGKFAENPMIKAAGGSGAVTVDNSSIESPLQYIRRNAGNETEIIYEPLYDFKWGCADYPNLIKIQKLAKEVDAIIIFVGYHPYDEAEGRDRRTAKLPYHMIELADEVGRFCKNNIVVLQTGCSVEPFERLGNNKAIVQMWYGGEGAGSAIADVLFGKINPPSGKLSETFMKSLDEELDYPGESNCRAILYNQSTLDF